ncbi:hypothetical protein CU098_006495, partial [Rhizopus stolonifer]
MTSKLPALYAKDNSSSLQPELQHEAKWFDSVYNFSRRSKRFFVLTFRLWTPIGKDCYYFVLMSRNYFVLKHTPLRKTSAGKKVMTVLLRQYGTSMRNFDFDILNISITTET